MKRRYTEKDKIHIVNTYVDNLTKKEICKKFIISKSTLYNWIKLYKTKKTYSGNDVSFKQLQDANKQLQKLQLEKEILRKSGCTLNSSTEEKFLAIMKLKNEYSIHVLCKTLDILRSTYYHKFRRYTQPTKTKQKDNFLKENILIILEKSKYRLGPEKIKAKLLSLDIIADKRRIIRLMKEMNVQCELVTKRKRIYKPKKGNKYYINRLQQNFTQHHPNKAWVSDITYVPVNNEDYYICVILDLFSGKIISATVDDGQKGILAEETFIRAYNKRGKPKDLLFHSDQGSQYTSKSFKKLLRFFDVCQSFSKPGYPYDNAVIESFFFSMKKEELNKHDFTNKEELECIVTEYIQYYNDYRPHKTLNYKTPNQIEELYYSQTDKNSF